MCILIRTHIKNWWSDSSPSESSGKSPPDSGKTRVARLYSFGRKQTNKKLSDKSQNLENKSENNLAEQDALQFFLEECLQLTIPKSIRALLMLLRIHFPTSLWSCIRQFWEKGFLWVWSLNVQLSTPGSEHLRENSAFLCVISNKHHSSPIFLHVVGSSRAGPKITGKLYLKGSVGLAAFFLSPF